MTYLCISKPQGLQDVCLYLDQCEYYEVYGGQSTMK